MLATKQDKNAMAGTKNRNRWRTLKVLGPCKEKPAEIAVVTMTCSVRTIPELGNSPILSLFTTSNNEDTAMYDATMTTCSDSMSSSASPGVGRREIDDLTKVFLEFDAL